MPSFGITPASGYPPATDQGFPRFIQWQVDGVDVGSRALVETVNIVGGAEGTVNSGGDTATIDLSGVGGAMTWRDVPGDYTLVAEDAGNGIATTGVSGNQTITVPADDVVIPVGSAILLTQYAAGGVLIVPVSGVTLLVRAELAAQLAGPYAVATLLKKAANTWLLCGDLSS